MRKYVILVMNKPHNIEQISVLRKDFMDKRVSMGDIAKELGVSKTTVSRAFKENSDISEQQRQRILKKANEMGYKFNSIAQSLRTNKTKNLGIIVNKSFNEKGEVFYKEIFHAMVTLLEEYSYSAIVEFYNPVKVPLFIQENKVDGVVILGQTSDEYLKSLYNTTKNVVLVDDNSNYFDSIVTENFISSYNATKYLISNGHSEIGYIGNTIGHKSILERFYGFKMALEEENITLNDEYNILGENSFGEFTSVALPKKLPSAYICNNDTIAFNLINNLKANGINVPDDVSVVGFDDTIYAEISEPKLTTCKVQLYQYAKESIRLIIERIDNSDKERSLLSISAPIVERDSVKKIKVDTKPKS